ncbi:hypothetical protein Kisp01_69800 [Kineosporia sp. NBRC 101677]|uniref:2'-5' RNA ligase family protein n=1 Tax=Kineosporia sp. NBRC 101677 TaxID=3032197 RepID=UPI00249FDA50|nr:2'-5' RNA ligase family protein [Kineosporia sp. NBRC 101677]GLY19966.1 hypothetical protein Kisp01_69800 [Kineosporia sp. NBRC 101677]
MESFFNAVLQRWPVGRQDYHWHILWPNAVVESVLVQPYQGLTHGREGVEPVPARWVHLTVLHAPPVEETSPEQIEQMIALVRQQCPAVSPWQAIVHPPSVDRVGVACRVEPEPEARQLWQITRAATREVMGDQGLTYPQGEYHPHTTLAYGTGSTRPAVVRQQMNAWMNKHIALPPASLAVTQLSLVQQSHNGRHITWRHVVDVPLAGQARGPAARQTPR